MILFWKKFYKVNYVRKKNILSMYSPLVITCRVTEQWKTSYLISEQTKLEPCPGIHENRPVQPIFTRSVDLNQTLNVPHLCLQETASMKDVVLAIRADEAHHRVVNHTLASMKEDDYNPYEPGKWCGSRKNTNRYLWYSVGIL